MVERIAREHLAGVNLQPIPDRLTGEGVPGIHGGARWWPATVGKVPEAA